MSSAVPLGVKPRPLVPPKPPIDTVRYSMNNIKESTDWQLDEILEELHALETQLNSSSGDQLLLGIPVLPTSSSQERMTALPLKDDSTMLHPSTESYFHSSCPSPDGDSAFGDASSTESARFRNSAFSSDSCRNSLHTPSPTQTSPRMTEQTAEEVKAMKIKQALEKMKEAKVMRIFVKFFVLDGAPLQILVDERWNVAEVMQHLADKHHITLNEDHCIIEEFPELYISRVYEDHENLVENIQMWVQDSPNKLYFIRRPDKYPFIERPELYLVTEKTTDLEVPQGDNWTKDVKMLFVQEFFSRETVAPPELEGFLYLKSDGRKNWKKHFFVLRPSGLYYSPKGRKSSKDLQCLMNLHSTQVYSGISWVKKYKAPTDWCLAIKLTQLQMKRSQYIKYICAEDEATFRRWLVGLRIAKNGAHLLSNYQSACAKRREALNAVPLEVTQPQVPATSHPIGMSTRDFEAVLCSSSHSDLRSNYQNNSSKYNEQPTGTIKRAPVDVLNRVSHSSFSSRGGTPTGSPEDVDSDEEFPAPPIFNRISTPLQTDSHLNNQPTISQVLPNQSSTIAVNLSLTPTVINTPSTPRKAPPPPPKRSEATRIHTQSKQSYDFEATLAIRKEKMLQN